MAHQKLTQEQEDQIRNMRKAGKTTEEVIGFMKLTYNIDIPAWKISYIVGKAPGGYAAKDSKKTTRKYHKHQDQAIIPVVPVEDAIRDITKGLNQIFEGYSAIFMHLRLAVIKEKGRVFNMAKSAGIEIKGEDTES